MQRRSCPRPLIELTETIESQIRVELNSVESSFAEPKERQQQQNTNNQFLTNWKTGASEIQNVFSSKTNNQQYKCSADREEDVWLI